MGCWLTLLISGILAVPLGAQQYRGGGYNHAPAADMHGTVSIPRPSPGLSLNGLPLANSQRGLTLNGLPLFSGGGYNTRCYGCAPSYGSHRRGSYGGYIGFVPLFDGYAFPSDYSAYAAENAGPVPAPVDPNAVALGNEVDRLRTEVDQLKVQAAATPPPVPAAEAEPAPAAVPEPATVIILRSGKRIESTSYAVMDQTLWNFSARPVQKIPLSSIDIAASERANAERGVDFSVAVDVTK